MDTPTATIFLPWHAVDEVHQRGTRAAQPAASAVVPGTLYAVTDEGSAIERSNGTAWQPYGATGGGGGGAVGDADTLDGLDSTDFMRKPMPVADLPAHHLTHEPGGVDAMAVDAAPAVGSLRTLGPGANQAAPGNDARFAAGMDLDYLGAYVPGTYNDGDIVVGSDGIAYLCVKDGTTTPPEAWPGAQTPVLHHATHEPGGTDEILNMDAARLTSGKVPDARFPATLPVASGVNLTNLNASNLASGSVPAARLPANVALTDAVNTFTQPQLHTSGAPIIYLTETAAPADARVWRMMASGQLLRFPTLNDALSAELTIPLALNRAGDAFVWRDVYEKTRSTPMGHWIANPFSAANFAGTAPMTWTVAAGNIANNRYTLVGKTLTWSLQVANSTLGGTVSNNVLATLPAGLQSAAAGNMTFKYNSGGIWTHGDVQWSASGNTIQLVKADFSNFTLGAFYAYLTVVLEVL